jgi:anti-sigma factor RsiW
MFEKADGSRLTLYYKSSSEIGSEPTAFRFAQEANGLGVLYWFDAKLGYALVGKLPKEELTELARKIYEQFTS